MNTQPARSSPQQQLLQARRGSQHTLLEYVLEYHCWYCNTFLQYFSSLYKIDWTE